MFPVFLGNIDLSKDKRRLAFKKDCLDFNTYATAVINRTSLAGKNISNMLLYSYPKS